MVACPEAKVVVRPGHKPMETTTILVRVWNECEVQQYDGGFELVHRNTQSELMNASLTKLASVEIMSQLVGWVKPQMVTTIALPASVNNKLFVVDQEKFGIIDPAEPPADSAFAIADNAFKELTNARSFLSHTGNKWSCILGATTETNTITNTNTNTNINHWKT